MHVSRRFWLPFPAVAAGAFLFTACGGSLQPSVPQTARTLAQTPALPAPSVSYQVIYPFGGGSDGGNPETPLAFDPQGNAYGTTVQGGSAGCGTIFRLHPAAHGQWQESVLYNFTCFADGKNPHGGVVRDALGNLYGTTTAGGVNGGCTGDGCGVVFELKHTGGIATLHTFAGGDDGFGPGSPLTFDSAGNLYGTAPDGGKFGFGTVFTLQQSGGSWHFHAIHQFSGGNGGGTGSLGALLVDTHGTIFGVTETGGSHQGGIAYTMTRSGPAWTFTPVYAFKGTPDGGNPYGGLIENGGKLYGTTYFGGRSGAGAVFELTPKAGTYGERVVYSFKGGKDGSSPTSSLLASASGVLYGTTSAGGSAGCGCGTVFSIAPGSFAESVLHSFGARNDGQSPYFGLTASGKSLYSSTVAGGTGGSGTIFSITP